MTVALGVVGVATIGIVALWLAWQAVLIWREDSQAKIALAVLPVGPTLTERRWELDDTQPIPSELLPVAPPSEGRPVALYLPPSPPRPRSHRPARVIRPAVRATR